MKIEIVPDFLIDYWFLDAYYISGMWNLLLLAVAIAIILILRKENISEIVNSSLSRRRTQIALALLFGLIFVLFPVATELYGDAWEFLKRKLYKHTEIQPEWINEIFSINLLDPKNQLKFTANIIKVAAVLLNIEFATILAYLSSICGAWFMYIWMRFFLPLTNGSISKVLVIFIGAFSGYSLVFYSHVELYSIQFLGLLAFFYQLYIFYYSDNSLKRIFYIGLLLLLNIKLHSSGILLAPCLALVIIEKYFWKERASTRRTALYFTSIIVFGALFFIYYYFLHTDNYRIHHFTGNYELVRVFLPLQSDPGQHGDYGILSWNHFLDFANLVLMWSIPLLVLFIIMLTKFKRIFSELGDRYLIIMFFYSFVYLVFFFTINPIWSIPRDFDLLSIPAIPVSIVSILFFAKYNKSNKSFVIALLIIQIIGLSTIIVSTNEDMASQRVHNMGIRTYKTYYDESANLINRNLTNAAENDEELFILQKMTYKQMKGIHDYESDFELSLFPSMVGNHYFRRKEYKFALKHFIETYELWQYTAAYYYDLAKTYLILEDYDMAYEFSQAYIKQGENDQHYLRVAFYAALYSEHFEDALSIGNRFIYKYQDKRLEEMYWKLKVSIKRFK